MPFSTSVVLCTHNGARFLGVQWGSLLAQTSLPDEIVVRDDASSDATFDMLDDLRVTAERAGVSVRLARNPQNLGYIANFQAALADATGDVLFLCDQDDVWHPDKVAVLVAQFERRPALMAVCTDARRVDTAGRELVRSLFDVLRVSRAELRRIHTGDGFGVLVRRSLATGAAMALRRTLLADALPFPAGWIHDEWLAITAAALGGFDVIERPFIDYRQHAGNQIGMPDRTLAAKWRDLVKPRAELIAKLIARDEALRERLNTLGARVPNAYRDELARKLDHLRARQRVRGAAWQRLGHVLHEAAHGNYRRYASGWRSVMRDLLRRD